MTMSSMLFFIYKPKQNMKHNVFQSSCNENVHNSNSVQQKTATLLSSLLLFSFSAGRSSSSFLNVSTSLLLSTDSVDFQVCWWPWGKWWHQICFREGSSARRSRLKVSSLCLSALFCRETSLPSVFMMCMAFLTCGFCSETQGTQRNLLMALLNNSLHHLLLQEEMVALNLALLQIVQGPR